MALSINRMALLLRRVRRWWTDRTANFLVPLGMVVVIFAAGLSNVPAQTESGATRAKSPPKQPQPQVTTPALPLSAQVRARLNHRRLTEAAMTSHNLTAAHFFGRRPAAKLSVETRKTSKQG
ncbi:MAG: hypothetical protein AAFR24_02935 [Cyanobacteria bacterium J06627_3]